MKKPSFIVGKKQIILACLTLILGVAVYINYAVTPAENLTPKASQSLEAIGGDEKTENYGDTKFVNGEDLTQNKAEEENNTAENVVSEAGNIVEEQPEQQVDEQGDMSAEEYFSQARLEKMTSHDNAVQTLQTIMGGGDLTEDEMVSKALEAVKLSKLIESEGNIESLVKSKGYEDCVVYLDGTNAKVVLKTEGLDAGEAASIKNIILSEVSVAPENIRIFEVR